MKGLTQARAITSAIWIAAITVGLVAVSEWLSESAESGANAHQQVRTVLPFTLPSLAKMKKDATLIVERDVFRLERHPARIPFHRDMLGTPPVAPAANAPRPQLIVAGIIGGPPWEALLNGLPGREGTVLVRAGQILDGLRIRSINRDSVVVQGVDTTWRLAMRSPWQ
jgi:type II secretory pathway component PulC